MRTLCAWNAIALRRVVRDIDARKLAIPSHHNWCSLHDTVRCLYHAPTGAYHEFREEFYITAHSAYITRRKALYHVAWSDYVRQTTLASLSEKIFPMGYLFLSRRGRATIRGKRAPFSPYGEPCARHDSTRLCVQAPTPRLVCRSTFVLLASKTNHAFHVPCHREQINSEYLVRGVSVLREQLAVSCECCRVAGDINHSFRG